MEISNLKVKTNTQEEKIVFFITLNLNFLPPHLLESRSIFVGPLYHDYVI